MKKMRRKDREQTGHDFFDEVFDKSEEIFLALHDNEYPYGIITNFVREGKNIFIHCAREGKKLDCLAKDEHLAFCVACNIRIDTAKSSTYYDSAYGTGRATLVEDVNEKRHALDLLAKKYRAKCPVPASEKMAARVAIIRISIDSLSGKACAPTNCAAVTNGD